MLESIRVLLRGFSRGLPLWVIAGALWAYYQPEAFVWTGWSFRYLLGGFIFDWDPGVSTSPFDLTGQKTIDWMFAITMFAMGTVIDPGSFFPGGNFRNVRAGPFARRHLSPVVLGLLTQFSVMPLAAWSTATALGFDDDIKLGFIIVGCAPGAMTSNVLTYLAKGDTAFSVVLTTFASILAVFLTPLLVLLLAGTEMEIFWLQLWKLTWTVATPLLLGIVLRAWTPRKRALYECLGPGIAVAAIVVICCFVIQWTHDELEGVTTAVFVGVVIVNALGYFLGNLLARVYRFEAARRVTLTIEIGMQNAGMGVILATTFDRPGVAIPAALFTIWCILTAAALIEFLRRRGGMRDSVKHGIT